MNVTPSANATLLAQSIVGTGIQVSNATMNCGLSGAGTFTYTGIRLGIPDGILLTTGHAVDADNSGQYFCNVSTGNNVNDPIVTAISSQARFDACVLEFDFVPQCDTLRITYVFGSEEYPRYINQYNDVFALFLTGPNPAGGAYASRNIATLPNGTTPVSINTVNGGWPIGTGASNPAFYVDNYTNPNSDIAYDGYTVPITSTAAVVSCQTYHMKIVVVDAGNGSYDSGVFIQGNTFTCSASPVASAVATPSCNSNGTATAQVSNYSGNVLYQWIPGGQTTATITNLSPGSYACVITYVGRCYRDTVIANVPSSGIAIPSLQDDTLCYGQSTTLQAICSGGNPPYLFSWSDGTGNVSPVVSPAMTTGYSVVATDANGCVSPAQTLIVFVRAPLQLSTVSTVRVCSGNSVQLNATVTGGDGHYDIHWNPTIGLDDSSAISPVFSGNSTTTYHVVVTDGCGTQADTGVVLVNVLVPSTPVINISQHAGCQPLCVSFINQNPSSCVNGTWDFGDGQQQLGCGAIQHCYADAGTFSLNVSITDTSGCSASLAYTNLIDIFPQPDARFSFGPNPVLVSNPEVTFTNLSTGYDHLNWNFGDDSLSTSTAIDPNHFYADTGCYTVRLIPVSDHGCSDTVSHVVCVEQEFSFYAPNSFTPDGDGMNEQFAPNGTGISMDNYLFSIYDRWGGLVFQSHVWGEGWNGQMKNSNTAVQEGVYVWTATVYDLSNTIHHYDGRVSIIK